MDINTRRSEMLTLEGLGISKADIVKQLSLKYQCSKRSIYNDFETRSIWQPDLQGVKKAEETSLKSLNRLEQIYHQAAKRAISSPNPMVQISALNLMLKSTLAAGEMSIARDILARIKALEEKTAKGDATA